MYKSPKFSIDIDSTGIIKAAFAADGTQLLKAGDSPPYIAHIQTKRGRHNPVYAKCFENRVLVVFESANVTIEIEPKDEAMLFTVQSYEGDIEKLSFLCFEVESNLPFAVSGLALNLLTDGEGLPGDALKLGAHAFERTGIVGAAYALMSENRENLHDTLRKITVKYTEDIPFTSLGGAFASSSETARGSYLFNMDGMTADNVDNWIELAQELGATQIDFHGGHSFRFGDCEPNPEIFPEGKKSFREIIERLHKAGIKAGLHTYAHFIDPASYLVTPVPHKDLGAARFLTLSRDICDKEEHIEVLEDISDMHTVTGFFVRNSVYIQIEDEIIKFNDLHKDTPFMLTGCERGALGTKPRAHKKGSTIKHLTSCFGLLAPAPDSELFTLVAELVADMYNDCGFDMIYMDALDGDDVFAGREFSWHYGSIFVFEVVERLNKAPVMEMSTMHHHLWYVRSRLGAWDCPTRGHKLFLDRHNKTNLGSRKRSLLPQCLGWWVYGRSDKDISLSTRMYTDDYEYMCRLALVNDWSLAYLRMSPGEFAHSPELRHIAKLIKRYEDLRLGRKIPTKTLELLSGGEHTLQKNGEFARIKYVSKTISMTKGEAEFEVVNPYGRQVPMIRIENLAHVSNKKEALVLLRPERDFSQLKVYASKNVDASIELENGIVYLKAIQQGKHGCARFDLKFETARDIADLHALQTTLYGDGGGEIVNIQLKSPKHIVAGFLDRLVDIDFSGERNITLIENDADRMDENLWPFSGGGHYSENPEEMDIFGIDQGPHLDHEWSDSLTDGGLYHFARERLDMKNIWGVSVWINNMLPGKEYRVGVGEISVLPVNVEELSDVKMEMQGGHLEISLVPELGYAQTGDENICFDMKGQDAGADMAGKVEALHGVNQVRFKARADQESDKPIRMKVTFGFKEKI